MKEYLLRDDPATFTHNLTEQEQNVLLGWIKENIQPIRTYSLGNPTSYGLKHYFERTKGIGFYITNGMFKGAMLKAGFRVLNVNEINWRFNISRKSKLFFTDSPYLKEVIK